MDLENLGTTKSVLRVGHAALLFSNGKPIATHTGKELFQDHQLHKLPPNSTRHALEWRESLKFKEEDIQRIASHAVVRKFFLEASIWYSSNDLQT